MQFFEIDIPDNADELEFIEAMLERIANGEEAADAARKVVEQYEEAAELTRDALSSLMSGFPHTKYDALGASLHSHFVPQRDVRDELIEELKAEIEELRGDRPLPNSLTREDLLAKIKDIDYLRHGVLTVCVLTLVNGFTVTGESACVDPANYDQQLGEKIAFDNAVEGLWELEGYLLQQKRHEAGL